MACNFKNIGVAQKDCKENFSGVGRRVFYFDPDELTAAPVYDETSAGFSPESFTFKEQCGAYEIKIKAKSGKVTSQSNKQGGGFKNELTFVIDTDLETAALVSRSLNNKPMGYMVEDAVTGQYFVLYDPIFDPEVSMAGDTGDAPDADKGFTFTVTCDPMLYPLPKWKGTLTMKPAPGSLP